MPAPLPCSKFNQTRAKPDECIARISPVTDWAAGGRTEPHHLQVGDVRNAHIVKDG